MGKEVIPPRTYFINKNGDVSCGMASEPSCFKARFATAKVSSAHTARLKEATQQINKILDACLSDPDGRGRVLDVLVTPVGPFLAWSDDEVVSAHDDPQSILRALGID